jgi:hypothetical protein
MLSAIFQIADKSSFDGHFEYIFHTPARPAALGNESPAPPGVCGCMAWFPSCHNNPPAESFDTLSERTVHLS